MPTEKVIEEVTEKVTVRLKAGMHHGTLHPDYDPKDKKHKRGPRINGPAIIEVTPAEIEAFGDKFEVIESL